MADRQSSTFTLGSLLSLTFAPASSALANFIHRFAARKMKDSFFSKEFA